MKEIVRVDLDKFRLRLPMLDKGEYAFLPPRDAAQSGTNGSVGIMYTFGLH